MSNSDSSIEFNQYKVLMGKLGPRKFLDVHLSVHMGGHTLVQADRTEVCMGKCMLGASSKVCSKAT